MRISIPTIPNAILSAPNLAKPISQSEAVEQIATFLAPGNVAVITGAGVSVDSGIRAYRGSKGRYLNPNYRPILYHELMDESPKGIAYRQRYWLRAYLGYLPVRDALPNTTHFALAALQYKSIVPRMITQNVDGLHHKALAHVWTPGLMNRRILELHGTLNKVHCKYGHAVHRDEFQEWIARDNPQWKAFSDSLKVSGKKSRTNPDGDVVLEGVRYDDFVVPDCPSCAMEGIRNNVQKPELVFFGESIREEVKDRSIFDVELCDRLFLIGTTLATFSAFRLVKHAVELGKPVLMLNIGPTRADGLKGVEKIELASGVVMRDVVRAVLGSEAVSDPAVAKMLESGITRPPPEDGEVDS